MKDIVFGILLLIISMMLIVCSYRLYNNKKEIENITNENKRKESINETNEAKRYYERRTEEARMNQVTNTMIMLLSALSKTDKYKSRFSKSRLDYYQAETNHSFILMMRKEVGQDQFQFYLDMKYWDLFDCPILNYASKEFENDLKELKEWLKL